MSESLAVPVDFDAAVSNQRRLDASDVCLIDPRVDERRILGERPALQPGWNQTKIGTRDLRQRQFLDGALGSTRVVNSSTRA